MENKINETKMVKYIRKFTRVSGSIKFVINTKLRVNDTKIV